MRSLLMAVYCSLLAANSVEAKPTQIVYIHSGQTITIVHKGHLRCTCTWKGADPPRAGDKFQQFSDEIGVTILEAEGGVPKKPKGDPKTLQKAIAAQELRVMGTGSPRALAVEIINPNPTTAYKLEVTTPVLAIPDNHGYKKDELDDRLKSFAQLKPGLKKIDQVRSLVGSRFRESDLPSMAFDKAIQERIWSGPKNELPWEDPALLDNWPRLSVRKCFGVSRNAELNYLLSSLLACQPVDRSQFAFLEQFLDKKELWDPRKVKYSIEPSVRAIAELLKARSTVDIVPSTTPANGDLTRSATLHAWYDNATLAHHSAEVKKAKHDLRAGDVAIHLYDKYALMSTKVSTKDSTKPTRIDLPVSIKDAVQAFERDLSLGGGGTILKWSRDRLSSAAQGKREEKPLAEGAEGCYLQILAAILHHKDFPAPKSGQKTNVFFWNVPRLKQIDLPMLHALLRAAKVAGFEREDVRWIELLDKRPRIESVFDLPEPMRAHWIEALEHPDRSSPLRRAVRHIRRVEAFPAGAANILALTAPAKKKEAGGAGEFKNNLYGRYLKEVKGIDWDRYEKERKYLPAVLELKDTFEKARGIVIEPPTLASFITDVKQHAAKQAAAASIAITLLTHRTGDEELVWFGREEVPLPELLWQLSNAGLPKNVVFSALSCGFAESEYAVPFLDVADFSVLIAPANPVSLGNACDFHRFYTKHRSRNADVLDAHEKARKEYIENLRQRLLDGEPWQKHDAECPHLLGVLPVVSRAAA